MEALNVSVRLAKRGATPLVGTPASSFALSEVVKALLDTAMWGERSRLETDVRAHVDKGVEGGLTITVHCQAAVGRGGICCYLWSPFGGVLFIGQLSGETNHFRKLMAVKRVTTEMRKRRVSHVGHSRKHEINTSLDHDVGLWVLFSNIIYTTILAWLTQNDGGFKV